MSSQPEPESIPRFAITFTLGSTPNGQPTIAIDGVEFMPDGSAKEIHPTTSVNLALQVVSQYIQHKAPPEPVSVIHMATGPVPRV